MTNSWQEQSMNGPVNSMDLEHHEFLKRIKKSLYYSKLPKINCLSLPVTELAAELFTEVKSGHTLEKLDVEEASKISRNACVSPCSLVLALLYIERLKNCNPEYLQQVAPSELFLVSLMVASKFLHDDGEEDEVFNKEWANSGQVTVARMNKLEKDFLAAIDWTVLVQRQDFWEKLQRLEKDVAYREVQKRGWCSYTELNCLLNSVQLIAIAQTLINVSSICLATYAAGLVTLVGSTLIAHFIVQSCLPGASLDPRQSVNLQTNLMSTDLLINTQSQEINANNLPISDSLILDENLDYSTEVDHDDDKDDIVGWQWWLNSMMTWLPEYCILENDIECTNSTRLNITNAKFSFNSTQALKIRKIEKIDKMKDFAPEDYRRNVNWKEALGNIVVSIRLMIENGRTYYIIKVVQSSIFLNIYYYYMQNMVYLHFPSNLTEEELMLQAKYNKLKRKKKALQDLKSPKQEVERIPQAPKRPTEARDAREVAKKLIKSGVITAPKTPKRPEQTFKRSRGLERKLNSTEKTISSYQPFSATQEEEETEAVRPRVKDLYNSFVGAQDTGDRNVGDTQSPVKQEVKPRAGNTIFVCGYKITEDYLKKHFQTFGNIVNISMEVEKNRGFITFEKAEAAERAISEMDGSMVSSIQLKVSLARRQPIIEPVSDTMSSSMWSPIAANYSQKSAHKDRRDLKVYEEDLFQ
ncbi:uncharacterized protein LOC114932552 [Nylanderia fulva]|nr:uncharacterized protein LOC114932552 [Nylanderia fulva]